MDLLPEEWCKKKGLDYKNVMGVKENGIKSQTNNMPDKKGV